MDVEDPAVQAAPNDGERTTPMPGATRALILLVCINLFNYIDRQVFSVVERFISVEMLADDPHQKSKIGLLASAFMWTYLIIAPVFGWLGDRFSRWWLIAIGVILWSLASGASGYPWPVPVAMAYSVLFLTRCFVGIGEAAYGPVAPTLISDLYPVKIRGRVLSWFYAAIPVGSALGYAWGGYVTGTLKWDWRWAFYGVVPPGILLGVLCFFMHEPPRGQADLGKKPRPMRGRDLLSLWHTPSYVYNTLGMTAMTFALGAMAIFMPRYLDVRKAGPLFGLNPDTAFGVMLAAGGLVSTLAGGWFGDLLRSRFSGSYFLVSSAGMFIGFPMVLGVVLTPFPWAWLYLFLAVFFLFFNTGPSNTILANVTHPSIRSTAFALNIFFLHAFGDAISPPLIGWISDFAQEIPLQGAGLSPDVRQFLREQGGMNAGFLAISLTILLGGLFWLMGTRHLERDTRQAPFRLDDDTTPV